LDEREFRVSNAFQSSAIADTPLLFFMRRQQRFSTGTCSIKREAARSLVRAGSDFKTTVLASATHNSASRGCMECGEPAVWNTHDTRERADMIAARRGYQAVQGGYVRIPDRYCY
jgi:hypothetical protein